jgi:hypothetical protein
MPVKDPDVFPGRFSQTIMHQDLSTSLPKKSLNSGIKKDGARHKNKVLIFHLSFFIHTYNHFKIDGAKRIKMAFGMLHAR